MTVPVVHVSRHDGILARGYADMAHLEATCDGSAWQVPGVTYEHHEVPIGGPLPDVEGAVVVLGARHHAADVAWLNALLARLSWAVLILCGDEEAVFPVDELDHPNLRVWVQTPAAVHEGKGYRFFGDGWWPGTREYFAGSDPPAKTLPWAFLGQITHPLREKARKAMLRDDRGHLVSTKAFATGVERPAYLDTMAAAKVAPAPGGPCTPDTFRLYEALEAGCVPIADSPDYWRRLFGSVPFPVLDQWPLFSSEANRVLGDWPASANRVSSWWMGKKRAMAWDLASDVTAGRVWHERAGADEQITVVMVTSPVTSHPSTAILDETLGSVSERLPGAEILLMCDGVRKEQEHLRDAYAEYLRTVLWKAHHHWRNVWPVVAEKHLHQSGLMVRALEEVRTPLVLFVEHDTPLTGEIPFDALAAVILSGASNLIRLHHEASVLGPHEHLMPDRTPQDVHGVPLLRCAQWSQRPHLASTAFYRDLMADYFPPNEPHMVEDVLHGQLCSAWLDDGTPGWAKWKVHMYAPQGDIKRSRHLDARGDSPKWT